MTSAMADYDPAAPATEPYQNGEPAYDGQDEDDDDDYDPSSFGFGDGDVAATADDPAQPEVPAAQPAKPPRTVAGFVIEESSDEDEEDSAPASAHQAPIVANGVEHVAEVVQDVYIASAPTTDSAAAAASLGTSLTESTAHDSLPAVPDEPATSLSTPAPDFQTTPDEGKTFSPAPAQEQPQSSSQSIAPTPQPPAIAVAPPPAQLQQSNGDAFTPTTQRLPHDKVGRLEDRIKDDPKADLEAWWSLIAHYREKDQLDKVREVYRRFVDVFPQATEIYTSWLDLEMVTFDRNHIDALFQSCLMTLPSIPLWTAYLNYLRRVLPLHPDPEGSNRGIITNAFEMVLNNVGLDPDSGSLWREYIEFHKSGPGNLGGTGWQDGQKGDIVRKAFQRAIKVPHGETVRLWKDYDNFELGLNKTAGRKFLQEMSPHYMTARTAKVQLEQRIDGLVRLTIPVLPPVHGFEGEEAFGRQVEKWQGWVAWEKEDPLVFKEENPAEYKARVLYVLRQATMQLRFYPPMWFEAAIWCFDQQTDEMVTQGETFIEDGLKANPESVLLSLKKAERLEASIEARGKGEDIAQEGGKQLDEVYEGVLKPIYALREKMVEREKKAIQEIKDQFAAMEPEEAVDANMTTERDDDDDEETSPTIAKPQTRADLLQARVAELTAASRIHIDTLKKTISYLWIAKMRAFRRVQGQGNPKGKLKGFRGVLAEARPRGQISSEVYVVSAMMEWFGSKDPSAKRIFERGLKLFPLDETFAGAYVKFLVEHDSDVVNARVVFETTVTKIMGMAGVSDDVKRMKVRPLVEFMHRYESDHGDLSQIVRLEKRMKELWPMEPEESRLARRGEVAGWDGVGVQLALSPVQIRPLNPQHQGMQGMAQSPPRDGGLRLGPQGPYMASPKRALDDSDAETPQRKFMRGESPLKGAAGRRLGHTVTNSSGNNGVPNIGAGASMAGGAGGFVTKNYVPGSGNVSGAPNGMMSAPPPPMPLPRDVNFLLQILPPAHTYQATPFDSARVVDFMRGVDVEGARARIMAAQFGGR